MDLEKWDKKKYKEYIDELKSKADEKYAEFHQGLAGADGCELIGVRSPIMRDIAKKIAKTDKESFLSVCTGKYYEERIIEGIIIGQLKSDFDELASMVDNYIPKITSWAINDTLCSSLKCVKKDKDKWFKHIETYVKSENPWEIRFGIILMMSYFLEDTYIDEVLKRCDSVTNDQYYVKMGQAWLLATAYAKCREKTDIYLRGKNNLSDWVYNKTIQKMRESFRIADKDKKSFTKK